MKIPCAISLDRDWIKKIDSRADSLGLSRSAYILQLVRNDILTGDPTLAVTVDSPHPLPTKTSPRSPQTSKTAPPPAVVELEEEDAFLD